MRCAVYGCNNVNNKKNHNRNSFFTFPKDENIRKKWVAFCQRSDVFSVNSSRICDRHFVESDFLDVNPVLRVYGFQCRKRLKANVEPTICFYSIKNEEGLSCPISDYRSWCKDIPRRIAKQKVEDTPSNNASDQESLLNYTDINNEATTINEASFMENLHANNSQKSGSNNSDTELTPEERITVLQIIEENDESENGDENDVPTAKRKKLNGQAEQTNLEEALQCMKNYMKRNKKRDEHAIFGELVAHKIRTCNRSNTDIAIAHHHIENVIFNLTMGVYNKVRPPPSTNQCDLTIPATSTNVVSSTKSFNYNLIIPKSEPE